MAYSIIQTDGSFSSSAMMTGKLKYDVFVSFRGEDTRNNFADHLFGAFQRKGIFAFRDDTNLQKGESLTPELFRAIEESQIFIVVFSKNYASSTWCLRELDYILHYSQVYGRRVLPIFYDVDPSEVRHQKGNYSEAFLKHGQRLQHDPLTVQRWKEALKQMGNISGWDLRHKPQNAEIEKIVQEIMNILSRKVSCQLSKELVGMDSPIEKVTNLLLLDSVNDVRVVGICGMGGIGKTTLTRALYGRISHQFDARCYIDDLCKIYRHDGPIGAQKQILHQTLNGEPFQICNLYDTANLIQSRLRRLRALIILDNVDKVEQLDKVAVNREWLGAGSRIIIVSRDEHILKVYGVDVVYKVPLLNETDSLKLFSQKAFKLDHILSSYEGLVNGILHYADGLPLAIKVLGSFLFGRDINEWKSALSRLRESPNKDVMDVLQLGFEGLEKSEKEIFLDIACFFNRHKKDYVQNVLKCCGFHVDIGLRVLIDKSLLSISEEDKIIKMQNLLAELGKKIVQENSCTGSKKWSRVWHLGQLHNVMLENMEKNVEAICIARGLFEEEENEIPIMGEALSKMSHLRLLILKEVPAISGNLSCLSDKLRYVDWKIYPYTYLPTCFKPNQLVELSLTHSSIKELWKDKKYLPNLRSLDLSHSKSLKKMPDFGDIPNLERLSFKGCVKLEQMDPSIGVLRKLVYLKLKDCKNLLNIPNNIFDLTSLKYLNLSGCRKVNNNQFPRQMKNLNSSESSPHSQSTTTSILASCLLSSLHSLYCLTEIDISFCGLSQLPDAIGCLRRLERLNIGGNNFVTLPSLMKLSKLVYLNLEHCKLLESLPQLPFPNAFEYTTKYRTVVEHMMKFKRRVGMLIFNCPKLGESERCSSMAFSWMTQFIQARQQPSTGSFDEIMHIVIPASEIPIGFKNQSEGDSIRMDLSAITDDNNCIGIACCAVFSIVPLHPTRTTQEWSHAISLEFTNSSCFSFLFWNTTIPVIFKRDLIVVKSNHMFVTYIPLKLFFDIIKSIDNTLTHLDDFKLKAYDLQCDGLFLNLKVQNCGYHLVYKQDLQESYINRITCS